MHFRLFVIANFVLPVTFAAAALVSAQLAAFAQSNSGQSAGGQIKIGPAYGPEPAGRDPLYESGGQTFAPSSFGRQFMSGPSLSPVYQTPVYQNQGPFKSEQYVPASTQLSAQEQMRSLSLAAWNRMYQAKLLIQQGRYAEARPLVWQFCTSKPLEPEGYFWQGICDDNLGQIEGAIKSYDKGIEQVLKAGMDCAELRTNLANDLLKLGRVDEAIDQYQRALVVDSRQAVAHLNLGRALLQKGDSENALKQFQRAEDLGFTAQQLSYYRDLAGLDKQVQK